MVFTKMLKIFQTINIVIFLVSATSSVFADDNNFDNWLKNFKQKAIKSGISKPVVEGVMSEAKFLPKVIEYDRYQPEFYEDTFTYIKKITSNRKVIKGLVLYQKERQIIDQIEEKFAVEKELLSLMGTK